MKTRVEGAIDLRFDWGWGLGQRQVLELLGEVADLAVELAGPHSGHALVQAGPVRFCDLWTGFGPRQRGRGPVVTLGDLGPVTLLGEELLLGQQVVGVAHVEGPDLVEQAEFFVGVETEVTDQLADVGPVLLLDVGPVVLVARTRPGEGDLVLGAVVEEVVIYKF